MSRRVACTLTLLALGAITSLAVAWGCSYCARIDQPIRAAPTEVDMRRWAARTPAAFSEAVQPTMVGHGSGFGFRFRTASAAQSKTVTVTNINGVQTRTERAVDHPGPTFSAVAVEAGWPFPCMYGEWWSDSLDPLASSGCLHAVRMQARMEPGTRWALRLERIIPTGILWTGLAADSAFYALALWVVLIGPRSLRRLLRARRHQCPSCGYPIGTLPTCTECGAALDR